MVIVGFPRRDIFLTGPFYIEKEKKKFVVVDIVVVEDIRKGERSVPIDKRLQQTHPKRRKVQISISTFFNIFNIFQ